MEDEEVVDELDIDVVPMLDVELGIEELNVVTGRAMQVHLSAVAASNAARPRSVPTAYA